MNIGKFSPIGQSAEFSQIYRNAKKWHCDCCVVHFLRGDQRKFAVVASKKIGNAVRRNSAKRRIRSAFFEISDALNLGAYVIVVKTGFEKLPYDKVCASLKWALKKVGAYE